jgi:uncharacterized protein
MSDRAPRGETSFMRAPEPKLIVNVTRGNVVCERVTVAGDALTRVCGFLGRGAPAKSEGLLVRDAPSVHTFFTRVAIDAVFLDSELRVVKLVPHLKPWRTARAPEASAVLELAEGETEHRGIGISNLLAVVDQAAGHDGSSTTCALLVSRDRRYRSVVSMLLTRRGYRVVMALGDEDIADLAMREGAAVVVIDASASLTEAARDLAKLQALCPGVGVVLVADAPQQGPDSTPVVLKWGAFGSLFEAIEKVRNSNHSRKLGNVLG